MPTTPDPSPTVDRVLTDPARSTTGSDDAPTELLLIRHGEKEPVTPEDPDPALTPFGQEQAELLAKRLAGIELDAVCASTMQRARQTALPIAQSHQSELQLFSDLREVELGDWAEGQFNAHAEARDAAWRTFAKVGRWDAIPGSEGDEAFRARVRTVLDSLAARYPQGRVAVVCHGGVINAALADHLDLHRSFTFPVEHTSISVLTLLGHQWFPRVINDCHHLYDPAGISVPMSA